MSLIWGRESDFFKPVPVDPTDDGDGLWIWCKFCGGTGEVEVEQNEQGDVLEEGCPKCGGVGGWYESLVEREENRQDEGESREER